MSVTHPSPVVLAKLDVTSRLTLKSEAVAHFAGTCNIVFGSNCFCRSTVESHNQTLAQSVFLNNVPVRKASVQLSSDAWLTAEIAQIACVQCQYSTKTSNIGQNTLSPELAPLATPSHFIQRGLVEGSQVAQRFGTTDTQSFLGLAMMMVLRVPRVSSLSTCCDSFLV